MDDVFEAARDLEAQCFGGSKPIVDAGDLAARIYRCDRYVLALQAAVSRLGVMSLGKGRGYEEVMATVDRIGRESEVSDG